MTVLRVSRKCNERCVFCNISEKDVFNTYFETVSDVEAFLDAAPPPEQEVIEISGGEPTLNPQLPEIISSVKRRGYRLTLESNAVRLADIGLVRRLTDAGLEDVFVSLHAANSYMSDEITGQCGAFEKTCRGIENLIACGVDVTVNYVWFRGNMTHLPFFARWLKSRFGSGVELHLSIIAPNFSDNVTDFIFRFSEVEAVLHQTVGICEEIGLSFKVADVCGLPLCFLRGIEHVYVDPLLLDVPPVDFRTQDKVKGPQCVSCVHEMHCAGVWKPYADLFGTDELKPVREYSTYLLQLKSALLSPITRHALRYKMHRQHNAGRRWVRGVLHKLRGGVDSAQ